MPKRLRAQLRAIQIIARFRSIGRFGLLILQEQAACRFEAMANIVPRLSTVVRLERGCMRSHRYRREPHGSHIPAEQPPLRYSRPWERSTR